MRISYEKTVTVKEEVEVPDHYLHDDSLRGKIVDTLLEEHVSRGRGPRDRLFENEEPVVRAAISALDRAYAMATKIMMVIHGEKHASEAGPVKPAADTRTDRSVDRKAR